MTTIRLPYIHTVWATGTIVDNGVKHPISNIAPKKRAMKPAPFYAVRETEFNIDTLDSDNAFVKFSIKEGGDRKREEKFCLDSNGNFYFVTNGMECLTTLEHIHASSYHISEIQYARCLIMDENHSEQTRIFPRHELFYGRAEDLSHNAVILGEGYDAEIFEMMQNNLDRFVLIGGDLCLKTQEPFLLRTPNNTRLISENSWSNRCNGNEYISYDTQGIYGRFIVNSVFQFPDCLRVLSGDKSLLRKNDDRNLTKWVSNMLNGNDAEIKSEWGFR